MLYQTWVAIEQDVLKSITSQYLKHRITPDVPQIEIDHVAVADLTSVANMTYIGYQLSGTDYILGSWYSRTNEKYMYVPLRILIPADAVLFARFDGGQVGDQITMTWHGRIPVIQEVIP